MKAAWNRILNRPSPVIEVLDNGSGVREKLLDCASGDRLKVRSLAAG